MAGLGLAVVTVASGPSALVARGWTYHRVYEDVLLILPETEETVAS
jgi:hypothetical protein